MKFTSTCALIVVCLALPVFGQERGQESKACQDAALFVAQQAQSLPKTYDGFVALPVSHRKAVYRHLSSSERAELWRSQWEKALENRGYTDNQQQLIQESLQLLTADTFETLRLRNGLRYEATMALVQDLEKRILAAFGKKETARLFAQIGPVSSQKVVLIDKAVKVEPSSSMAGEACSCSTNSDYCPNGYGCGGDSDGCNIIEDDCGFLWTYNCNGECLNAQ